MALNYRSVYVGDDLSNQQVRNSVVSSMIQHPGTFIIAGPGRVGKTTLTQQVCDELSLAEYFYPSTNLISHTVNPGVTAYAEFQWLERCYTEGARLFVPGEIQLPLPKSETIDTTIASFQKLTEKYPDVRLLFSISLSGVPIYKQQQLVESAEMAARRFFPKNELYILRPDLNKVIDVLVDLHKEGNDRDLWNLISQWGMYGDEILGIYDFLDSERELRPFLGKLMGVSKSIEGAPTSIEKE